MSRYPHFWPVRGYLARIAGSNLGLYDPRFRIIVRRRPEVRHLSVFAHTIPHSGDPWYSGQRAAQIEPTADTLALIGETIRLLRTIWRPGFRYSKAGVMFAELGPAALQNRLFLTRDPVRSAKAMAALDTINARFGRGTVRPASTGMARSWGARQQNLSPRYTTQIGEILIAQAF